MADLKLMSLTADIVASYLLRNEADVSDLPDLIRTVYEALQVDPVAPPAAAVNDNRRTAAQVRRSIRPEALVSFIDGKPYKTLKRHLATHGHTPQSYREMFGLPDSYPMVCSAYSAKRSDYAKATGLGQRRRTGKTARR